MGSIKIGTVELGKIPRVVAIVNDFIPLNTLKRLQTKGVTLFEIRVDLFTAGFYEIIDYVKKIKNKAGIPLIGTIRETEKNRDRRLVMFERMLPLIDCVDIEIDAGICRKVIDKASGKIIILSEHNFKRTPTEKELVRIVTKAKGFGADIIKIAAMAKSRKDVVRLLQFTMARPENMVTISMGEIGKLSRIVAPLFGSLFSYAYIYDEVASGQLPLDKVLEEFETYFPGFKS